MELEELFGNLVHNRYMEHFDYRARFKFQTVFYKTQYSYSCCPCGFENEFIDYIKENGEINEAVYGKIVQSIREGKCPHVTDKIPEDWVKQTCVSGLHIAIAVGTEIPGVKRKEIIKTNKGIFGVSLLSITLMKKGNANIAATVNKFVYCLTKLPENTNIVTVKKVSYFEALVQTGDTEWVRKVLKLTDKLKSDSERERLLRPVTKSLNKAFKYTLDHGLNELTEVLFAYIKQQKEIYISIGPLICRSAIMQDKADILKQVLNDNSPSAKETETSSNASSGEESEHYLDPDTFFICDILNRPGCKSVLLELGLYEESKRGSTTNDDAYSCLLKLLKDHYDNFKDEILGALKEIPHVEKHAITFFRDTYGVAVRPDLVKAVLDLGVDIALLETTIFLRIVQTVSLYNLQARETVKLLINANPDLEKNGTVVPLEFSKDEDLICDKFHISTVGTYQADCKEHGLFGYESNNFALNFSGPFFSECGFPVKREELEKNLRKDVVHPSIHDYIKQYIDKNFDNPKSLVIQCRESLRKQFKGKALHCFLADSDCPQSVKDFVLMKTILQTLNVS